MGGWVKKTAIFRCQCFSPVNPSTRLPANECFLSSFASFGHWILVRICYLLPGIWNVRWATLAVARSLQVEIVGEFHQEDVGGGQVHQVAEAG